MTDSERGEELAADSADLLAKETAGAVEAAGLGLRARLLEYGRLARHAAESPEDLEAQEVAEVVRQELLDDYPALAGEAL